MQCPHCDQETDPTLQYCMSCGEPLELDPEQVKKHFEKNEEIEAIEFMEGQTRGALYATAFLLVCVVIFRLIVVRALPRDTDVAPGYNASLKPVAEKNLDEPAALEVPRINIEIPDWRPEGK
ncbi:MAG TPA: hypothetical protein VFF73_12470 [Planctomycetota bacterium]|nr:hypothetical protein [Planctomycetota bacterium]